MFSIAQLASAQSWRSATYADVNAAIGLGALTLTGADGTATIDIVPANASIGGLAKVYDTGSVIDSYVPEMMKALDRLGRILFLYYWKNDDFAERYGTEDIADMEDLLRSVFKSFGELVLQLRKKSIDNSDANTVEM